jgi:hypothetical protein
LPFEFLGGGVDVAVTAFEVAFTGHIIGYNKGNMLVWNF